MSLYKPSKFTQNTPSDPPVYSPDEVPKDMDIFYRSIENFLPEGKNLEDLTPEELKKIKNQYRFDVYRPGIYQGITGIGKMAG